MIERYTMTSKEIYHIAWCVCRWPDTHCPLQNICTISMYSNTMNISCVKEIDIVLHGVSADGQICTAPDKIYVPFRCIVM